MVPAVLTRWLRPSRWTLGIAALMLMLNAGLFFSTTYAFESLLDLLQYDRTAILQGQIWRLITGNLVHWSAAHFLLDISVFVFVGLLFEDSFGKSYPWMLLVVSLVVTISVLVGLPEMITYRGFSGVDSGQLAGVLCLEFRSRSRKMTEWFLLIGATGMFVVKLLYEVITGRLFFVTESLGDIGAPVPLAHVAGTVGALVFLALQWSLFTSRRNESDREAISAK
jgi:rhomboid family GlyGly-CTERM serine protease